MKTIKEIQENFINNLLKLNYPELFNKIESLKRTQFDLESVKTEIEESFIKRNIDKNFLSKAIISINPERKKDYIIDIGFKDISGSIEELYLDGKTLNIVHFKADLKSKNDYDIKIKYNEGSGLLLNFKPVECYTLNYPIIESISYESIRFILHDDSMIFLNKDFLENAFLERNKEIVNTIEELSEEKNPLLFTALAEKIMFDKPINEELKDLYKLKGDINLNVFDRIGKSIDLDKNASYNSMRKKI